MTCTTAWNRFLKIAQMGLALSALIVGPAANAGTIVFSDDFEDGLVNDWNKSTNFGGTTAIVASGTSHTGNFGLETYLEVPPLSGTDLYVRASHDFLAPVAGDYILNLWARSTSCNGCTISYDVIVDGTSLARSTAPTAFEERTFSLEGLAAGPHTITLGMFTTLAVSGHFFSSFDDVVISTSAPVPELPTFALLAAGLVLVRLVQRTRQEG
jgi:hypothetical protein